MVYEHNKKLMPNQSEGQGKKICTMFNYLHNLFASSITLKLDIPNLYMTIGHAFKCAEVVHVNASLPYNSLNYSIHAVRL